MERRERIPAAGFFSVDLVVQPINLRTSCRVQSTRWRFSAGEGQLFYFASGLGRIWNFTA